MKIKCVITDDEPMARKGLQSYVEKVDFLSLEAVFEDAMQLNTYLQTSRPDLIFLDIEMPYLSGLDILSTIENPPYVIITTAYEKYALKGYELNVADYLLKPISFDRFLKAVNKIYSMMQTKEETPDFIFVRSDRQMYKIFFKDILYVKSMENYICLYTEKEKFVIRNTMKHMIDSLPSSMFLQIHKSYLINIEKIDMINGNQIIIGDEAITIARNFRDEVFDKIMKNAL